MNNEETVINFSFDKDEVLKDCSLEDVKKQTTPPARYTEASLVKKLQDLGIGRPSTYATIVETVLSSTRGYAELEEKKIVPTEKGMQLSAFLDRAFGNIINLNYTRDLEESLDEIANGDLDKLDFLKTFYNDLVTTIKNNTETGPKVDGDKVCPKCGAPMVIRRSRFGKLFYGCSQYPNCNGITNIE